jgi:hypothetical protein
MNLALCILAALYLLAGVGMCLLAGAEGWLGRAIVAVLWLPLIAGGLAFEAGRWLLRRRRPDEEEE